MSKMTEADYQTVLRILGESGQIERYQFPVISDRVKNVIAWLLIGSFNGFIWGFVCHAVWF